MIRTQIQLEGEQHRALKAKAAREARSLSEEVREAVALYLSHSSRRSGNLRRISGKYSPIPTDDLKPHDRDWADSVR